MRLATYQTRKTCILYDAQRLCDAEGLPHIGPEHFQPDYWQVRGGVLGEAPGRGTSVFINPAALSETDEPCIVDQGEAWVLRPYRRGGMVARLSRRHYLWTGLERTRAFRELRLLARLYGESLPVPRPVAAAVFREGAVWSGALITVRIPEARALADLLMDHAADTALLERVGGVIRRFHAAGLDHVDLNARNLLVDAQRQVWLIDLDRCRLRSDGAWKAGNLRRLRRSLVKSGAPAAMEAIRRGYAKC
ncbi:MAG TPA: 3-deoxy-D-manno-octulosonic acid kinase [Halomonas sp.]|nr:3-deoxy-D-manno-octulosonic acid kinase [Halomonas sp.]